MCILRGLFLQLFGHFRLKKYPNFLILLSKIAEIHVWNKLKSYKKAPISTQILSAIKSNEQVLPLTVNVMDRIMSTSIILLDQNFNTNDVDIMVFEPSVFLPPSQFGGNR